MTSLLSTIAVGFISALLGGLVQTIYSRLHDREKFVREGRKEVYSQYLNAMAAYPLTIDGSQERTEVRRRLIDAKARICLYGGKRVIEALDRFARDECTVADVLAEMRHDVGFAVDAALARKIQLIVRGNETRHQK
jgi:hypothetical protein